MAAAWPQDLWPKIESIVKGRKYKSANEEFGALRTAVQKASPETLVANAVQARLGWEFLLGFAAEKSMFRAQVVTVSRTLVATSGWSQALAQSADLRQCVDGLHEDIKEALRPAFEGPPPSPAASGPVNKADEGSRPSVIITWPDWAAIEAACLTKNFRQASDEFATLRKAVLKAAPRDLAAQEAHASHVWRFLVGFAAAKALYRGQIAETVRALRQQPGWEATLTTMRPELSPAVAGLHDDVQSAFGAVGGQGGPAHAETSVPPAAAAAVAELPADPEQDADRQKAEVAAAVELAEASRQAGAQVDPQDLKPLLATMAREVSASYSSTSPPGSFKSSGATEVPVSPPPVLPPPATSTTSVTSAASAQPEAAPAATDVPAEVPIPPPPPPVIQLDPARQRAQPFLQRALELEAIDPVIAHYCRLHAVEILIRARKLKEATAESDALLMSTLEEAELKRKDLDLTHGQVRCEALVYNLWNEAVGTDDGSTEGFRASPQRLYMAAIFMEVLGQFHGGELPQDLAARSGYAKGRAVYIRDCLRKGCEPCPPTPPPALLPPKVPRAPQKVPQAAVQASSPLPSAADAPAVVPGPAPAIHVAAAPPAPPTPTPPAPTPSPEAGTPGVPPSAAAPLQPPQPRAAPAPAPASPLPAPVDGQRPPILMEPVPSAGRGTPAVPAAQATKLRADARKKVDAAYSLLDRGDSAAARQNIIEALGLLEGLS